MVERASRRRSGRSSEDREGHAPLSLMERKFVRGVALDSAGDRTHGPTKNRDDALWWQGSSESTLEVATLSATDVSAVVPKDSSLDRDAMRADSGGRPLFPLGFVEKHLTLKSGEPRATLSVEVPFSGSLESGDALIELTRLQLERAGKLTHEDVAKILDDPSHAMFEFFNGCADLALHLRGERGADTSLGTNPDHEVPTMIVEEFAELAHRSVTSSLAESEAQAIFRRRNNGLFIPDFEEGSSVKITGGMRRRDALVNQRVLSAFRRREEAPYSQKELENICKSLNKKS